MEYEKAKIFSNGTEYEIFRDNYCEHGCIHHKERDDGFTEFLQRGGCPIENLMEDARWDKQLFPNVLLEVWDDEKCLNWHHCPFYTAYDPDKIVEQLEELANEHPYKVIGKPDTYSSYNEAWEVCADRAIEIVKGGVE